jgi:hypothetical protein
MVCCCLCRLIVVEEPEAQDAIDAIVDHRRVMEGMSLTSPLTSDSVDRPSSDTSNPYTDLEYCVRPLSSI